ncbi:glutamine amidotransferase-related protein [Halotalea alkalilenta]|uniref:glutamine amidotransferase-related protein n=1 Tax=Halotalea alkalilenta TaxID=376489 RepID=UPI000487E248|nr:glutamine amidotransferase [Halotalea alkalilenta]
MRIGLLQCDDLAPSLRRTYGNYPELYERLLRSAEPSATIEVWRAHEGELPEDLLAADVWLISGSKASVYEAHPWIAELVDFVRLLWDSRRPLIGICFGHQLICKALGGVVERSHKGWGLGVSFNQVVKQRRWMSPWQERLGLVVSHQDQVVELPPVGEVIAESAFCPNYLVEYRERFLGIQGHPEFSRELSRDLMKLRDSVLCPIRLREGVASLEAQTDDALMARWMVDFYYHALAEAQSYTLVRSA